MASTAGRLDIYNMALGFIGTGTISSPNENRPEAIQCNLYWDRARRSALRDYPYSFAQARVQLAERALPEVYEGEWQYAYAWPDKCLKVHRVHRMGKESARSAEFEIRNVGTENIILTNVETAQAEVTVDNEDVSLWDELFVMSMARKLACLICVPIMKNNQSKVNELEQLYAMSIPESDAHDASERRFDGPEPDAWLAARGTW